MRKITTTEGLLTAVRRAIKRSRRDRQAMAKRLWRRGQHRKAWMLQYGFEAAPLPR